MIPHFLNLIICRLSTWKIIPELFTPYVLFDYDHSEGGTDLLSLQQGNHTTYTSPSDSSHHWASGQRSPHPVMPSMMPSLGFLPVSDTKISDITQETMFESEEEVLMFYYIFNT